MTCSPAPARDPATGTPGPRSANGTGGSPPAPGPSSPPAPGRAGAAQESPAAEEPDGETDGQAAIVPMPIFDPFREAEKWR